MAASRPLMTSSFYIHNWSNVSDFPYVVDIEGYRFKHNLLYRDRAGHRPQLTEHLDCIATAIYSHKFADRTLKLTQVRSESLNITITI